MGLVRPRAAPFTALCISYFVVAHTDCARVVVPGMRHQRALVGAFSFVGVLWRFTPSTLRGFASKLSAQPVGDAAPQSGVTEKPVSSKRRTRKRPTRAERGSYVTHGLPEEVASWPEAEIDGPLYNTRDFVIPPGGSMDGGPFADLLRGEAQLEAPPGCELQTGAAVPASEAAPYDGATRLLSWRTRIVLSSGADQFHPLSSKAEVSVELGALAKEVGISTAGLEWMRAVCGTRWDRASDTLRLVSQRYRGREDNRRDCVRTLNALIAEGVREGGPLDMSAPGAATVKEKLK